MGKAIEELAIEGRGHEIIVAKHRSKTSTEGDISLMQMWRSTFSIPAAAVEHI